MFIDFALSPTSSRANQQTMWFQFYNVMIDLFLRQLFPEIESRWDLILSSSTPLEITPRQCAILKQTFHSPVCILVKRKKEKWRKNKIYIVKNIMASSSKESTNKRYFSIFLSHSSPSTRVHVEEAELGMGDTQRQIATRLKENCEESNSKLENSDEKSRKSMKLFKFMIKSSTSINSPAARNWTWKA